MSHYQDRVIRIAQKILIRNVQNKQGKFPGKPGQYTDNIVYTEAIDFM